MEEQRYSWRGLGLREGDAAQPRTKAALRAGAQQGDQPDRALPAPLDASAPFSSLYSTENQPLVLRTKNINRKNRLLVLLMANTFHIQERLS